ncbi:MAG: dCTP deaminase [Candidatus Dojkabacteria bacterium]
MVLTRSEILARIDSNELVFEPPLDGFQVQPHAIDLRLGFDFLIPKTWTLTKEGRKAISIDPLDKNVNGQNFDKLSLKQGQYFELLPGESVIGATLERIDLKARDIMCVLYPRSSINRRGLAVDLTGIIDVGYKGSLVIPIVNKTGEQIIRIYPGERICQIVFQALSLPMSRAEARKHGLTRAKYHLSKSNIQSRTDRRDETDLIKKGKISELKRKYKIGSKI